MIVGLTGYKQSGKTTVADYLVREHGFTKVNFKDALIAEMLDNFPDTLEAIAQIQLGGRGINELFEIKPSIMRSLMQNYGTDVRRKDNPNYWIDKWKESVAHTKGNIVVDDVRFINEAEAVNATDGVIVLIKKKGQVHYDNHTSEKEHLDIAPDFTLECEQGEPEVLCLNIDKVLSEIKVD